MLKPLAALFLTVGMTVGAWAQVSPSGPLLKGQGSAQIRNGDLALARWQATADALKNAMESQGASVQAGTLMSNGQVFETLRIKSDVRTRDVQVLEEKRQGDQLYITVQASIEPGASPANCSADYRKRAVFTAIPLLHPTQLKRGEAGNLPSSLATLMAAAAERSGRLDTQVAAGTSLLQGDNLRPRTALLVPLLGKYRAQTVVTGVIRNFYPVKEAGLFTLFEPDRLLELDIQVFGALEEAPLASRRFSFRLPGSDLTGPAASVGSEAFAGSAFGQALTRALDEVGSWVADTLACAPFTARVLEVDGTRLVLDAGSQGGLREGDGVIVFRPGVGSKLSTPLVSATVRQVWADRAAAEARSAVGAASLRPGDIVVGQ